MSIQYSRFYIALAFIGICIIGIFLHVRWNVDKSYEKYLNQDFQGVIKRIHYREGSRSEPDVLLDKTWYLIPLRQKEVILELQVGDSIVKKSNSIEIKLFKKDSSGVFKQVIIENKN